MSRVTSDTTEGARGVPITITLPHPPASLSPNGRALWPEKSRDAKSVRQVAFVLARHKLRAPWLEHEPWPGAVMDIHWLFAGTQPDDDNVIARCKAIRDGIADAGLVADDSQIQVGAVTFEKVRRVDQAVRITLTRKESADA